MPFILIIVEWLGGLIASKTLISSLRTFVTGLIAGVGFELATNARALFDQLLEALEWREQLAAWVLKWADITISPDNLEDVEAWKIALGERGARSINAALGTSLTTIYPPDTLREQIQREVEANLLNGGGGFISSDAVARIKKQVEEKMLQVRGLAGGAIVPILGTDTADLKKMKRRANNRAYQREYRANKRRLQLWVDDDMQSAVTEFEAKIKTILDNRERPPRPPRKKPTPPITPDSGAV